MMALKTARSTFLKRWLQGSAIAVALAAACMMFGTATLKADCGVPGKHLMGSVFHPAAFVTMAAEGNSESHSKRASVVGQWHVLLLVNGDPATPLFQSLVQYHSDGMEAESADQSSITPANYCMGVWKQHGNKVEIYHIAWLFDNGTPVGYAVITQKNVLDNDGDSYKGTFEFKQYDNDGNLLADFNGTTQGRRIDFHHPFTLF
jgi:hypothetical protein